MNHTFAHIYSEYPVNLLNEKGNTFFFSKARQYVRRLFYERIPGILYSCIEMNDFFSYLGFNAKSHCFIREENRETLEHMTLAW